MGFHFRKSMKIAPGVRVNFNKKSTSVTIGGKGVGYTFNPSSKKGKKKPVSSTVPYSGKSNKVYGILLIILAVVAFLLGLPTISFGGWVFLIVGALCLFFGVQLLKNSRAAPEDDGQPHK